MKEIYLIDGNSFLYRSFFATPYLATSKGIPTNATYAFTNMVRKLLKERSPNFAACIFDSKLPSFRVEISKTYKAQRPPMPSNLSIQIPYVKGILQALGIKILEIEGFEADDVIASIIEKLRGEERRFFIVTNDKDMMQIVSKDIFLLDTMKERVIGEEEVRERFGVSPQLIPDFLALAGDVSDNIPGVQGIGEKLAKELLSSFGSIEEIYRNLDKLRSSSIREKLERGKDLAFLSKKLAIIRTDVPLSLSLEDLQIKKIDKVLLKRLFKELEFTNLLKELRENGEERVFVFFEKELKELKKERISFLPLFSGEGYDLEFKRAVVFDGEAHSFIEAFDSLSFLFSSPSYVIIHNLKPLLLFFKKKGFSPLSVEFFDVMLAAYLLNPLKRDYSLEGLLEEEFDIEVGITERKEDLFHKASLLYELEKIQRKRLEELHLSSLFFEIEMPLIDVLASMEYYGVKVKEEIFFDLSKSYEEKIKELTENIYRISKRPFNLNSPKQLSHILFDVLHLPKIKKTKKGYSTDTEVLQELSKDYEIADLLLKYRSLTKLKNSYIDPLPNFINKKTGRIHARFDQMTAVTGRIISSNPNLQNIPIRGEEGKRIREAFIAEDGFLILSADYSQIELRILAHLSGDQSLMEAFYRDEDIHERVAKELFKTEKITEEMRRLAKVVNFGIIYGISSFGLSKELNISQKEAEDYIIKYFERYKGVREYIERVLEEAREKGSVRTLFGRLRYIPEIRNPDINIRQLGERTAINTPIQGTAADIIKLAMVNIHRRFKEKGLVSRLIIQIHDELVFEVKEEELELVKALVKEEMEKVVSLSVPLKIKMGIGKSWADT